MEKKSKPPVATNLSSDEKMKALDDAILAIEKAYGRGSIMKFTQASVGPVEVIPTGCLTLDLALGIGGLPRGRIVEIYGPESSGKTTLSLHVIAQAQKLNGNVAFIDAEHALDPIYAQHLGIDLSKLYISQPDNGEQALDICEALVRSGAMDVVVVDSVAALTPKAEIDGEMGDSHIGLQARLMSQALRKLAAVCSRAKTIIIFINQLREKVGVMFGSPEVTAGGKALKFYASIRLDVRKCDQVKDGTEIVGNKTRVKVVKNKLAPPFRVAEFDIIFGKGISRESCILELAVAYGIMTKSGSWFNYNEERLGQGKESMRKMLVEKPELADEIESKIRDAASKKPDADVFIDKIQFGEETTDSAE